MRTSPISRVLLVCGILAISGCATHYGAFSVAGGGGFRDLRIEGDVYRVSYFGNGFATRETVQTFWLYRASELALEKGFDGFQVLSPIQLGRADSGSPYVKTQMIIIPMDSSPKPFLEADIRLLKGQITASPPRVFDARALKKELEPYVKGQKKCDSGNVCPHVKRYLQPLDSKDAAPAKSAA